LRTFFLFYLLSWLLRNPLLALVIVGVIFYFSEARYSGRYFNPTSFYTKRHAIGELRQTLTVNEHDAGARNDLGRLLADDAKFAEALPHMELAIKRMEESAETNYYYGLCLLNTGDADGGERFMKRSLEISPRFLYGEPQVVLARHCLGAGRDDEALAWAREAVKINTSSVEGWVLVGDAERTAGRTDEARAGYTAALEAYDHVPRYLRVAARKPRAEAKRGLKSLG